MSSLLPEQAGVDAAARPQYTGAVYATTRPQYPAELYQLLASLSKDHKRVWDVGTGTGQAAVGLANHFEEVIATDVSKDQLDHAEGRPNITYSITSYGPLSDEEVARVVGDAGSLDLITVAQAVHWFDLPSFYAHVQRLLKPGGIIAVWCYTNPQVDGDVDKVLADYFEKTVPFWTMDLDVVFKGYQTLHFPFKDVVQGQPIRMDATRETNLEGYLGWLESWSVVNAARKKGVELIDAHVREEFKKAWGSPSHIRKLTFPVYVRIGTPSL